MLLCAAACFMLVICPVQVQMPLSWDWCLIAEQCSPGRLAAWGGCCLAHLTWPHICRAQGFLAHAVCSLEQCSPRTAASRGRHHYSPTESINMACLGSVVFLRALCVTAVNVYGTWCIDVLGQSLLVLES